MAARAKNDRWPGWGLGNMLGGLVFFALAPCMAQNLVPNHSFEEYDTCRVVNDVYYPDTGPLGWFSAGWTPDHFMSCLPYGSFNGVPLNLGAFQYPQEGECYGGVITYHQNVEGREYFMVELTESLVQGQTYYASFYANAAWGGYELHPQMWVATSHIGMLFTTHQRQWEYNDPVPAPGNFAHVYHPWVIADTVGWTLVSGSFVADSAYRYIVLGNFFSDALTDTVHLSSESSWAAYYFYDAICVSPTPGECPMVTGIAVQDHMAVQVGVLGGGQWLRVEGAPVGSSGWAYDAGGRVLAQWAVQSDGLLDIGNWAEGLYVLRIAGPGMTAWSGKFVVMR